MFASKEFIHSNNKDMNLARYHRTVCLLIGECKICLKSIENRKKYGEAFLA